MAVRRRGRNADARRPGRDGVDKSEAKQRPLKRFVIICPAARLAKS
jgi:hypothetical protein